MTPPTLADLGGGFKLVVIFTPIMEEIIQCDLCIPFQGGEEKNHQLVWDESKIQSSIFVPQMLMVFFFFPLEDEQSFDTF